MQLFVIDEPYFMINSSNRHEHQFQREVLKAFCHLTETAGASLVELRSINKKLKEVIMNQTELAQALNDFASDVNTKFGDLAGQLVKALDEIRKAIQNAGEVTPEVQAALDNAKAIAQAGIENSKAVAQELDDLNPDEVPPQP